MNIWYFSAYDQPRGQSTRTYDFSKELVARGHRVTIFTNSYCHFTHVERLRADEKFRVEVIDGIDIVWIRTFPYTGNGFGRGVNMLTNFFGILRISPSLNSRPDVVLGPSVPLLTGLAASIVAKRYAVPFIFEVRDVWPDALVDIGGISATGLTYRVFRFIERLLYRRATRISSVLPFLKQHVEVSGGDPTRVVCIPNGVSESLFKRDDSYGGGIDQNLLVMYVGGFGLDHDVMSILRAAKILQDSGDFRFRFEIYGSGAKRVECELEVERLQLRNLVLLQPIAKVDLPNVQCRADILIATITDSKSYRFGLNLNKLCSYFASCRPVVFAGNPPNDPVKESGAGISVAAGDVNAIVASLKSLADLGPASRLELGRKGRVYAERYMSMPVLASRMENVLTESILEFDEH